MAIAAATAGPKILYRKNIYPQTSVRRTLLHEPLHIANRTKKINKILNKTIADICRQLLVVVTLGRTRTNYHHLAGRLKNKNKKVDQK